MFIAPVILLVRTSSLYLGCISVFVSGEALSFISSVKDSLAKPYIDKKWLKLLIHCIRKLGPTEL